ncbi:MAG: adenine deaminase [Chloroflexi bacterium]|nr:adenine deaminase [Chloroflexota bacterium]
MQLGDLIQAARGEVEADLLLKNSQVVNVFSGDIHRVNVAISRSRIVGLGDYRAEKEIDLDGMYLCPGFIDGHVHIESSMVRVAEFARAVVPNGTTSVIIDPHEIANVLGLDGIRYMLESSKYNPLSVFVMLPSCVPATNLETSGATLQSWDLSPLLHEKWVVGLGEVMNYPGVLFRDPQVLAKIDAASGKRIDGHAPGLSGRDLCAYVAAGIGSDHECTTLEEAREKLRLGMYIMIREGTIARNLEALLPLVTPANARRCMFVTDDRHPAELLYEGHINSIIKKAIGLGLDPIIAIQMATINPARYFGLTDKEGIAPGRQADLVVFDNFKDFNIRMVFRNGVMVARDGKILPHVTIPPDIPVRGSMNVNWGSHSDFHIHAEGSRAKVIGVIPDQIVTEALVEEIKVENGLAVADTERDILKLAVVERHLASGNIGLGFVKGFGLKRGALASSVAHDSHNLIVLGTNDEDMMVAARQVIQMGGGLAAASEGAVLASLPLPIAGLMSRDSVESVNSQMQRLLAVARELGSSLHDPFMSLSFLSLPVIPALKLTDRGLVDVTQFKFVPLFERD